MKLFASLLFLSPILLVPAQAALLAVQSGATLVPGNQLSGTVTYEGWDTLNTSRINNNATTPGNNTTRPYGFHSLTGPWTGAPIASNVGSGTSTLFKTGGYGYIASGSLHQGAGVGGTPPGGTFTISSTAISGVQTYLLLIQATDNAGLSFSGVPTLSFGSTTLAATFSSGVYANEVINTGGGGTQNNSSFAFQWDLTGQGITEGTALTASWTGIANSSIYQIQANQGTNFAQVVPEPSAALLGCAAIGLTMIRRRRA